MVEALQARLRAVARRVVWLAAARTMVAVATGGLLIVAAAVVIDAAFALPEAVRHGVRAGALAAVVFAIAAIWRAGWRARTTARQAAVQAEESLGLGDSRFITALDLTSDPAARVHASAALVERAIQSGVSSSHLVEPGRIVSSRPVRRAARSLLIVAAVLLAAFAVYPRLWLIELPRLVNPSGDHPPFTFVKFKVTPSADPVIYGDPVTIDAELSGLWRPSQADVVFVDSDGREQRRVPMLANVDAPDAYALALQRVEESLRFYIDTPRGRSRTHTLAVRPAPTIDLVEVTYHYPAYTGWTPRSEPLKPGGIVALAGTRVEWRVRATLPLGGGTLRLTTDGADGAGGPSVAIEADPADPHAARGSFTLTEDGRFTLAVQGVDGTPGRSTLEGAVRAIPDAPPRVQMDEPAPVTIAPVGARIPVDVMTTDDVGLRQVALHAGVNGIDPEPLLAEQFVREVRRDDRATELDLGAMQAAAGDILRIYASAFDTAPEEGQLGVSATHEVHVLSREEYDQLARQQMSARQVAEELEAALAAIEHLREQREQLREQAEQILQAAADRGSDGQPSLTEEERAQLAEIGRELAANAQATEALAGALRERAAQDPLYEFDPALNAQMERLAEQMQGSAAAAQDAARAMQSSDAAEAAEALAAMQAADQDQSAMQEAQRSAEELDQLRRAAEMRALASQIVQIADAQMQLADLMSEFDDAPTLSRDDLRRLQHLAQEQHALRQELERTRRALSEVAQQSAEDLPQMSAAAAGICEQLGNLDPMSNQSAAATAGEEGEGATAVAEARSASEKLESLISECSGLCNSPGEGLDGCLGLSRSQLASALSQMGQGMGQGGGSGTMPGFGLTPGIGRGASPGGEGPGAMAGGLSGGMGEFSYKLAGPLESRLAAHASLLAMIGRTGPGDDMPALPSPMARGERGEGPEVVSAAEAGPGGLGGLSDWAYAPPGYREHTRRYFAALANRAPEQDSDSGKDEP